MIDWTNPKELFWFQRGMIYAIVVCKAADWPLLHDEPLLAWWKSQVARYKNMPSPGAEDYNAYLTAFLEGAWAYVFYPERGVVRLQALQDQVMYYGLKQTGQPIDDPQTICGAEAEEEREAFLQGFWLAQAGHTGEIYPQYASRLRGYNDHLPRLLASAAKP